MNTQTVLNDVHLKEYDNFTVILDKVQRYFETVKDYAGFPKLPDNFTDLLATYEQGTDIEKNFMFGLVLTKFVEALRHWKTDKDNLYPNSEETPFFIG
jgi:hypothetical protein